MNNPNNFKLTTFPLVSIITPAYNAMPFIRNTIESVQSQNYPAIEHIVIDGGSTDGTTDLLKRYSHLVWVSEPDKGQSDALNKGLGMAQGEIIGWLNADDTYNPGAIRNAVSYFQNHPEADVVYSDCEIVDECGEPIRFSESQPFAVETLLLNNYIKQPTVFMRKKIFKTVGGVYEDLRFVMDWELWLRIGLLFNMHYIHGQTYANFRYCKGTKSFEHSPLFHLEWINVLERASKILLANGIRRSLVNAALRRARGGYYLTKRKIAEHAQDWKAMNRCLFLAVYYDWSLIFDLGIWHIIVATILGKSLTKRFRKLVRL